MFKIIPFEPGHVNDLEIGGQSIDIIKIFKSRANELRYTGPCFTGIYQGHVVVCAGLVELWPGVAIAWAVLSRWFPRIKVHRAIKEGLTTLIESCNYHRVQASVPVEFEAGHRWLRSLGFKAEVTLREYGPDKSDFIQYVRIT